ncbi:MAG: PAS-domain containing protein [Alphaproteobacteria bacterium]|nr:PAS-domain containing protein [Alphaproteobacteria bacterium]
METLKDNLGSPARLRAEKARLEAFLSAVPGEYCGWAVDGNVAYSKGFCDLLGINKIERFSDIQNCLSPDDSAAAEGMFTRLMNDSVPFTMNVQDRACKKILKLSGTRGRDLSGQDVFSILWLEDITDLNTADKVMQDEQNHMREEMELFQDSLDALPCPVWIRDENQRIIWCNVTYAKMIKFPPSEIIAQQKEIISEKRKRKPSEKDVILGANLAKLALEKGCVQSVQVHEVLGGERLLVKVSETPVKDGQITLGMIKDLTDQELVQKQREISEAGMRSLLGQMRSAICIYNAKEELEFYNSSFAQLWGLEEGWLNTWPKLGDILEKLRETRRLPEQVDFKSYKKSWLDMFTGLIDPSEDMLYLPDGSVFRMLVVPRKQGGIMMTFEDVSSRLELESSYNTLIAVQKETLDNLEEAVAVYGGDGRLKLWNPSFARMWAFDPETLDGEPHITRITKKMSVFFVQDDWRKTCEQMISLALERDMNDGRFARCDDVLIDYATVPLPDGGVLITYSDVTDTVRVENALWEKNKALETAEKLKLDFLANVSYNLRTPLNAIMGFNDMLDQEFFGSLNKKQKEYTHDISDASERLLSLINDILDLSTIEADQMELNFEDVSIKTMMESAHNLVEEWARKQKIEINLKCPANIGNAEIDKTRIKQVIINLVRNAISNTQEGGRIELSAAKRKEDIKITVKDTGIGIEEKEQDRILQPFERIENAQQISRGAGLGLTLVDNIISLHGGSFDLESSLGEGTTVTLYVPRKHQ